MLIVLPRHMGYRQCSEFCLSCQRAVFFMISGYLFFGERSAQPRHSCVSAYVCFFIAQSHCSTLRVYLHQYGVSAEKPAAKASVYHLWFFFAIAVIYLVSPLIQ